MQAPWLKVPLQTRQTFRARGNYAYGAALHKVYPAGAFFITAQNGAPSAPGQPPMARVFNPPGTSQVGDPRAADVGYWGLRGTANLTQTGPVTVNALTGGSNFPAQSPATVSSTFILLGVGALALFFLFFR
jgi:hypothetical protein